MLIKEIIDQLSEYYPFEPVITENTTCSTWFVPHQLQLPLTLVWNSHRDNSISAICALGKFPDEMDSKIPLELLTVNTIMAAKGGPRFSYSPSSGMLTLIGHISSTTVESHNIYLIRDEVDHLIEKGNEVLVHMENQGIKLSNLQG
ncbi:CesT family type III secretion system chaperone [Ewingella americana]|uniref:CesT family type III secretion system chaperone n=1 Tax=Ewingella americana TaxID=41202 RepID=UPI0012ADCC49|nr:CesT family type III secretion system chaperone [Ewingella americana]MRT06083.1 hypothetical protein [Ewingella americana]